jgi:hypothetical protein
MKEITSKTISGRLQFSSGRLKLLTAILGAKLGNRSDEAIK